MVRLRAIARGSDGSEGTRDFEISAGLNTVNLEDFGLSTEGMEAAIASLGGGGRVVCPAGIILFDYFFPPERVRQKRAINLENRAHIEIVGQGKASTILKTRPGADVGSGDSQFIYGLFSQDIALADLTLDGNRANVAYPNEHCAGLYLNSAVKGRFTRVRFSNFRGDGHYLIGVGSEGRPWTEDLIFTDCDWDSMGRASAAHQRGVRNIRYNGGTVLTKHFDIEPTIAGKDVNLELYPRDIEINDMAFSGGARAMLQLTICLDVRLNRVTVTGGYIEIGNLQSGGQLIDVEVDAPAGKGAIECYRQSNGLLIQGGTYVGRGTANAVIAFKPRVGFSPEDVTLDGVHVISEGGPGGVSSDGGRRIKLINGSVVEGAGLAGFRVIQTAITGLVHEGFEVRDSHIKGFSRATEFRSRGDAYGPSFIEDNTFEDADIGFAYQSGVDQSQFTRANNTLVSVTTAEQQVS